MRRMLTTTLVLLALAAGSASAQEFSSLEERMSAKEFKEAGLDKLTPEELARLNAWLGQEVGEVARNATPAPPVDRRGFEGSGNNYDDIETRIAGEFTGWDGRDGRFVLTNGQVWQSVDPGSRLRGVKLDSPLVKIEAGAFGAWFLSVEGYNSRVKVKRVK
jgi:hypothetical protein